jgi:hypothetical protein
VPVTTSIPSGRARVRTTSRVCPKTSSATKNRWLLLRPTRWQASSPRRRPSPRPASTRWRSPSP